MKIGDPIARVRKEEVAHGPGIRSVEVDRFAPFIRVTVREVIIRELFEVIPVRAEVVVDDVKNDSQTQRMCLIDERAKIVRCSIQVSRGKEIDTVITPPEIPREL